MHEHHAIFAAGSCNLGKALLLQVALGTVTRCVVRAAIQVRSVNVRMLSDGHLGEAVQAKASSIIAERENVFVVLLRLRLVNMSSVSAWVASLLLIVHGLELAGRFLFCGLA